MKDGNRLFVVFLLDEEDMESVLFIGNAVMTGLEKRIASVPESRLPKTVRLTNSMLDRIADSMSSQDFVLPGNDRHRAGHDVREDDHLVDRFTALQESISSSI